MKLFNRLFTVFASALTVALVFYIWFIAEDRYTSESQFSVVVDDTSSTNASLGLLALVGANNTGNVDTQSAIGFIHSSDLLLALEKEYSLVRHYSKPKNDFAFKLAADAPLEDRLTYYRSHIKATFNAATGLIELSVETFDPKLSHTLSQEILLRTEDFINGLNQDIAEKRLDFVKAELSRIHDLVKNTEQAVLEFQNTNKIIHPEALIQAQLAAIQNLRIEKIDKNIQLSIMKASSPQSPMIPPLELTINEISTEIAQQEASLSGSDQETLNQLLVEYKELQLNLEFAMALRKGAEILLEKTRTETISHSRFFSVIQNPYLAEDSINPRRSYLTITLIFTVLLIQYIITAIIRSVLDKS